MAAVWLGERFQEGAALGELAQDIVGFVLAAVIDHDEAGFAAWLADYEKYLPAEKAAIAQNA